MGLLLDDTECKSSLFPFTKTRHVTDIRIGILTIKEKWEMLSNEDILTNPENALSTSLKIKANLLPDLNNFNSLLHSQPDKTFVKELEYPWQIFQWNDWAIREDFKLLIKGKRSQPISETNKIITPENIFIEEGAKVEHSVMNASLGPIYIGKNSVVMEGNLIRGPFALCEGATLKMGSRIYGATTIGPYCIAGGEIKNSVMFGYSNKAHDGYLGDSVIGEWCNLGAGTSNSNIKNTGSQVNYSLNDHEITQSAGNKGGLLMGDYSRAAINSSFNTGTVVGVCCNIYEPGLTKKYYADFSWGMEKYDLQKALNDINNWKKLKGKTITDEEKIMLTDLYKSNQ